MDPRLLHVLHDRTDEHVTGGVAECVDIDLPGVLEEAIDQDGPFGGESALDAEAAEPGQRGHRLTKGVYGTHPEQSINREVQGWRVGVAALRWLMLRRGPLTTGSAPVGGFWYTRDGLDAPDVQIHFASGATLYNEEGRIRAMPVPAMTAVVNQSRPESVGSIHITSADPGEAPAIRPNYLDSELDRVGVISGGSIYPFVWNILLSARNEGLGGTLTTFVGGSEPDLKDLLGVPDEYAFAAMLPIGQPVNSRMSKPRLRSIR